MVGTENIISKQTYITDHAKSNWSHSFKYITQYDHDVVNIDKILKQYYLTYSYIMIKMLTHDINIVPYDNIL